MTQTEDFLAQALASTPAPLRAWVPAQKLRHILAKGLERDLAWTRDEEFAARFARQCPCAGAPPAAYLHRLLPLPSGGSVLAGIRFKGGDLSFPFVELLAADWPWTDAARLREAAQVALERFAPFSPVALRLLWDDATPPPDGPWRAQPDLCYLAAPLAQLQARPAHPRLEALTLRLARDLSFYPRYEAAWSAFQRSDARWRDEVMCSDPGDFDDCLRFGLVCEAWRGDQWVGLFAARRLRERYLDGYVVQDMVIDPQHRGQGWAAPLQQGALRHLAGQRHDLLFGTIHAHNAPSLATAARCGRLRLSTYLFLTPAPPGA